MIARNRQRLVAVIAIAAFVAGCRTEETPVAQMPMATLPIGTNAPEAAETIQQEIALTAGWVSGMLTASSSSGGTDPANQPTALSETPIPPERLISSRVGPCQVPAGMVSQPRSGFCIATPADWIIEQVDGNVASGLNTTPGQVIAMTPAVSGDAAVCNLMVYLTPQDDPLTHLEKRLNAFMARLDLTSLSAITYLELGDLLMPGFTWEAADGDAGALFADQVRTNLIVHIAYQGSDCPPELLLPVLNTLYFD